MNKGNNIINIVIGAFTIIVVAIIVFIAVKNSPQSSGTLQPAPTVGSNEIDFTLPSFNNNQNYTLSSYKGKKPVILEFMAFWCPHCQNETKVLDQVYSQYSSDVQIIAVQASPYYRGYESTGLTTPAGDSDYQYFKNTLGVQYPILKDPNIATANKYGVTGFPTFYLIDKTGKIVSTTSGEQPLSYLTTFINKYK